MQNKITGANAAGHVACHFGSSGPPASLSSVVRPHDLAMKLQHIVPFILCCMITACDRRSDGPPVSGTATSQVQKDYDEQLKRQQAQLDAYDKHSKHAEHQLRAQAEMQKRAD